MSNERFESVLLFAQSETSGVTIQIAQHLKQRYRSRLVLLVGTEQDKALFVRKFPDLFDAVESMQFRYRSVFEPIEHEEEWFAKARAMERRFGFTFSDLLMDDRHFGRGFSAGGTNYPDTRWSRSATYGKAVRSYVMFLRFFEELMQRCKPTLVVNPTKACCVIARAQGIPIRFLTSSGFKGYWTWTANEYMESDLVEAVFREGAPPSQEELDRHYGAYLQTRSDMLRRFSFPVMSRNVAYEIVRYVYYCLRRYEKRYGMLPFENARANYRIWSGYRALKQERLRTLEEFANRRFVYFPLSVEPEVTLTRESPEFNHQAYAIQSIAKSLPVDVFLAVKEHFAAIGHRPPAFYRDLAMIPNVILVDPSVWGLEMIKKSAAVATISGTSGFEAGVLGVPVLTFSQHVRYKIMPHIRKVEGWDDLPGAVSDVLSGCGMDASCRLAAGKAYLDALVATSVDCGDADFRKPLGQRTFDEVITLLARSLEVRTAAEEPRVTANGV